MSEQEGNQGEGDDRARQGLSVWQIVKSTLAAFFGVQTPQARERDFEQGNPLAFILAGIIGTAIFVVVLIVIVNLILVAADTG